MNGITPKTGSARSEKAGGVILVLGITSVVAAIIVAFDYGISFITINFFGLTASVIIGAVLLKTTIAIRGMERHAFAVIHSIEQDDIESARDNLSMIVKRNTKNLDRNHVFSGVLESVSENTVDGVTGPLFYFAIFGLPGAFVYRTINTIDSMIGYKNDIFSNLGWFGANCDKVLNYLPARITGFIMILGAMILRIDWKACYKIMLRDGTNTQSPNAGYPMAALAGALGTKFEKMNHYTIGQGNIELTKDHVRTAISLMKITSILFCGIITIPIILVLSYLGWWLHA